MHNIFSGFSSSASIFFTMVFVLVTLGVGFLIYKIVMREHYRYKEESKVLVEGLISKADMHNEINNYINRIGLDGFFCLMYIDIDKFGEINDIFGVSQANLILEELATMILKNLPRRTFVTRYKNDEFLIFFKGMYDRDEIKDIANDILNAINHPIKLFREATIQVTASMGICFYPQNGERLKDLMINLNLATYVSKREGGNRYTVFKEEFTETESTNLQYFQEVKNAIQEKQFTLYYQPIINVLEDTLYGFEALIRWNHPEHGVLQPHKFLTILENSGDIYWVGLWGLETVLKKQIELKKMFPHKHMAISLNISVKQLINDKIAEDFRKLLKHYQVDPSDIILEIYEFAMFEQFQIMKTNLLRLKDYGFKIAIDGFGIDYSTLSRLEKLPIDIIKLDRSFLEDDSKNYLKQQFLKLLVDYSITNDKQIISYGVENQEMLDYVKQCRLYLVQGYYYAMPMSDPDMLGYIKEESYKIKHLNHENLKSDEKNE